MEYFGQFTGTHDVELGDAGIVYLFYSNETRERKLSPTGGNGHRSRSTAR
jgi:hypothetical protein